MAGGRQGWAACELCRRRQSRAQLKRPARTLVNTPHLWRPMAWPTSCPTTNASESGRPCTARMRPLQQRRGRQRRGEDVNLLFAMPGLLRDAKKCCALSKARCAPVHKDQAPGQAGGVDVGAGDGFHCEGQAGRGWWRGVGGMPAVRTDLQHGTMPGSRRHEAPMLLGQASPCPTHRRPPWGQTRRGARRGPPRRPPPRAAGCTGAAGWACSARTAGGRPRRRPGRRRWWRGRSWRRRAPRLHGAGGTEKRSCMGLICRNRSGPALLPAGSRSQRCRRLHTQQGPLLAYPSERPAPRCAAAGAPCGR